MRQSYGMVSVDDIAVAAGIKKGSFYHHFCSKADLALAAYEHMWGECRQELDACFSPTVKPEERLPKYAEAMYVWQKQIFDKEGKVFGCPISSAGAEMGAQDDRIRAHLQKINEGKCAYFASVLRDLPALEQLTAADRMQIASEMISYTMGVMANAKVANDPDVIRRELLPGLMRFLVPPAQSLPLGRDAQSLLQ